MNKAEVDSGKRAGVPTEVAEKLKALERENRELKQANEILRKASAYFALAELDRRSKSWSLSSTIIGKAYGVEPICKILPIAPSTYHAHLAKRVDPLKLSERARRDLTLKVAIRRVFAENFEVYGVRKVWLQLNREGIAVARCTIARLMRAMGLHGVIRGKPVRTTIQDQASPCPLDRVNRQFKAPAPNISGCRTSPMSRRGAAWSMSLLSSTPMPDGSLAGGSVGRLTPPLSSMRLSRPCMNAAHSWRRLGPP